MILTLRPALARVKDFVRGGRFGWFSCILILSCCLYVPPLSTGFLTDDYILLADLVKGGIPWFSGWLSDAGYIRPLVAASLALDLSLFGTEAFGYHVVNLIVHLATVGTLFHVAGALYRRCAGPSKGVASITIPGMMALGFALHPANVVDVVWISGRTDLLAGLGTLLAAAAYLRERGETGGRVGWMTLVATTFTLGCKEIGVTIAPLLVLMEIGLQRARGADFSLRTTLLRQWPLWILMAGYGLFRLLILDHAPRILGWEGSGLYDLLVLFFKPILLTLFPLDLLTIAAWWLSLTAWTQVLVGAFGCLSFATTTYLLWPRGRGDVSLLLLPIAGLLILCLPLMASGIVIHRVMYVPMLGAALLGVPWLARAVPAAPPRRRRWLFVLSAVLIVAWAAGAHSLASEWPRVGTAERRAVASLVGQLDDADRPIVIVTYPHRVRQTGMFWSFEHRLAVPLLGTFGKVPNVFTGFGIIGKDLEGIGREVALEPADLSLPEFTVTSSGQDFLMLDQSQVAPSRGILVVDRPGTWSSNRLVDAEVLRVNEMTRPASYRARIVDSTAWATGSVFVWQAGEFRRIR